MMETLKEIRTVTGEGRELRCRYLLVVGEKRIGRFAVETYGVRIEDTLTGESAIQPELTVSPDRADRLLALLIRNRVTPAGLEDVVADWL